MRYKIIERYKHFIIENHEIVIYKCNLGRKLGYMAIFMYDDASIGLGVHNNPRKAINRAKSYINVITK